MTKKVLSFWTALIFVAILTILGIFMLPSSAEKAWLFGLSAQRAVLAFFPFTCIVFCIIIVALSVYAPDRYQRMMAYFRQNTLKSAMLTGGLCFWAALFLIVFLLYYQLFIAPNTTELTVKLGIQFTSFCAYVNRLWPVFMFLAFCMAFWTVYVTAFLKQPLFRNTQLLIGCIVGVFCILATLFQWVVFIFQLRVFEQIPGWYWPIIVKPEFLPHSVLFGLFLLLLMLLLFLIYRFPRATY